MCIIHFLSSISCRIKSICPCRSLVWKWRQDFFSRSEISVSPQAPLSFRQSSVCGSNRLTRLTSTRSVYSEGCSALTAAGESSAEHVMTRSQSPFRKLYPLGLHSYLPAVQACGTTAKEIRIHHLVWSYDYVPGPVGLKKKKH